MNDPMIERLRTTLQARADSLSIGPRPWVEGIEVGEAPARPRPMFWVFAAAMAVLVGAGGVIVAIDWQRRPPQRLAPTAPAIPSIAAPPTTVAPTSSAPADVASNAVGWYVPSWIPDGFQVASASAMRMPFTTAAGFMSGSWIDRRDGRIDRRLTWTSFVEPDSMLGGSSPDVQTVRGVPARVSEGSDGSVDVHWYEAGRTNLVNATMDRATVLAIIEAATLDTATGFAVDQTSLPAGVEYVAPAAEPAAELGLTTSLTFSTGHGPDAGVLNMSVSPNLTGATLDSLTVSGSVERTTVDGVEREVTAGERDGRPWVEVRWFAGGFAFAVGAENVDRPTVETFAAGITAADEATFLTFDRTVTDRGIETPLFDQVVFDDGLTVALRAADDTTFTTLDRFARPGFLCLEGETHRCASAGRGGGGGGDQWQINVSSLFEVDGRKTLIYWLSGDPQNVSVTAGSAIRGETPRDDPIPFERLTGTHGVFLRIDVESDLEFVNVRQAGGSSGTNVSMEVFDQPIYTTE